MARRGAQLAGLVLGLWLLAQACTLLWQAGAAYLDQQALAAGAPRFAWSLADADAIVAPGSEGISGSQRSAEGLRPAPGAQVVDLSLALRGRPVALGSYRRAELDLRSDTDLAVALLVADALDGTAREIARRHVRAGAPRVEIPLPLDAPHAQRLRLRIERSQPGTLVLERLALRAPRCSAAHPPSDCPGTPVATLAWRATPERLLAARDAAMLARPAVVLMPAHLPETLARAGAALRSPWPARCALALSLLVLGWSLRARMRGGSGHARQLLVLFAVPVLLLLSGQPDASDDPVATLAFLAACTAALVHPGGRRDWRWLGNPAAWRGAAVVTVAAALVIALAALLALGSGEEWRAWRGDRLPRYLAWALLQQALLLVAIAPRMAAASRDAGTAALLSGALFALLHLPNFSLMLATLLAATAWALLGLRHRALLPLVASHAVLGTLLVWAAPEWLLRSAEVGGRFLLPP